MKEIKIKVVDWWNGGEADKNYFLNFLSKNYKVTLSDKPDYLLCSLFGNDHLNYDCVKIFSQGKILLRISIFMIMQWDLTILSLAIAIYAIPCGFYIQKHFI